MPPQDVPATTDRITEIAREIGELIVIDQALAVLETISPEGLYEAATRKRIEKLYKRIRGEYLRRRGQK